MSKNALAFTVVNVSIMGSLGYFVHTGELKLANLPIVAAICLLFMNGLAYFMLIGKKS